MNKFFKFFTSTFGIKVDSYDEHMVNGSVRSNNRASKLKMYRKKYFNYSKVDEEYIKEYYENNQGVLEILASSSNKNIPTKNSGCGSISGNGGTLLQYEYIGLPEKLSSHKRCRNVKKGAEVNKNKKVINNKKNIVEKKKKTKSNKLNNFNRSDRIGHFNIKSDSYYSLESSSSSLFCAPYAVIYESGTKNIVNSPRPQNKLVFNKNYNSGADNIEEQRILGGNNSRYRPNNTSSGGSKKENNDDKYETVKIGHNVHIHADVYEKFSKMSGEKKDDKDDVKEKCVFTKSNEFSIHSTGEFTKLPNLKTIMENVGDNENIEFYNDDFDEILDLEDSPLLPKTTNTSSRKCTKNVLLNDSKNIIDCLKNIIKWK